MPIEVRIDVALQNITATLERIEVALAKLQVQNRITWGLLVALLALLLRLAWKQGAL
jgi:hypothetical protein